MFKLILISVALSVATANVNVQSAWNKPSFCKTYDCPEFSVVNDFGDFVERVYVPSTWTTTTGIGSSRNMFMRMFYYIRGQNEEGREIKMTIPVKRKVMTVEGPQSREKSMSFYVAPTQTPAPIPMDSRINVEVLDAESYYVRQFGGFARSPADWRKEAEKLEVSLAREGLADYDSSYYYTCGYDSPWKMFNRHNEVWFKKNTV